MTARTRPGSRLGPALAAVAALVGCVTTERVIEGPLAPPADAEISPLYALALQDEEDPEWPRWQRPDALLDWIDVPPDARVLELGAAIGRLSERIAARLGPRAALTVADNDRRFEAPLRDLARADPRIRPVLLDRFLDGMPAVEADLAIVRNFAYRAGRPDRLYEIARAALRPGARLILVDFRAARTNPGPPLGMRIPETFAVEAWEREGFRPVRRGEILPCQYVVEFAWDGPLRRGPLARPPR